MPKQQLCFYCRKPIDQEKEDFVNIMQHEGSTIELLAHTDCYRKEKDKEK